MFKISTAIFIFFGINLLYPLHSEVEKIVLTWSPGICNEACEKNLEKRLHIIPEVAEIKLQNTENQVILRWRPDRRFSYNPINSAFRFIGIGIRDSFVTVRGTVSSSRKEVFLKSLGDGTEFELLNPAEMVPGQAPVEKNRQSYALTPKTREKLLAAEGHHQIVTVQGKLFQPERGAPFRLIIEKLNTPRFSEESELPMNREETEQSKMQ